LHDGRGQNHQAYLWQYGRPGGGAVFEFQMGRGREGPKGFLGEYSGILQTDRYVAYERVGGPEMVHAACWAHARRKFVDAVKLHPGDVAARQIVERIDELFGIDRLAREQEMDRAARHQLRLQQSPPLLETIRREIETARSVVLFSSAVGKAAKCTLTLWQRLTRFMEHPVLELGNNLAENSMRVRRQLEFPACCLARECYRIRRCRG
jgi:hypothetical protein